MLSFINLWWLWIPALGMMDAESNVVFFMGVVLMTFTVGLTTAGFMYLFNLLDEDLFTQNRLHNRGRRDDTWDQLWKG